MFTVSRLITVIWRYFQAKSLFEPRYRDQSESVNRFLMRLMKLPYNFAAALGVYTVTTFVVGMFVKVELGLKILGYGVAGFVFFFPCVVIFLALPEILRRARAIYRYRRREGSESRYDYGSASDSSND
jgi:hypothetical protein